MENGDRIILKMKESAIKKRNEDMEYNAAMLKLPEGFSSEEAEIFEEFAKTVKESINYRLSPSDLELIVQYCRLKVMRDRAWKMYNVNPERYVRIVTGICQDGKTPKVVVKENEHYKTFIDCGKQLEKILKDLMLTPDARRKKNGKTNG